MTSASLPLTSVTLADLSAEQKRALDILRSGRNVFLSGCAGSGKTSVVRLFLQEREDALVCASTGIAALLAGGITAHSLFSIPRRPLAPQEYSGAVDKLRGVRSEAGESSSVSRMRLLLQARTIVIDEVSMLRFDTFQFIANTLRRLDARRAKLMGAKAWRTQVVVVGDFCQLPPVLVPAEAPALAEAWGLDFVPDGGSCFAFMSQGWWDLRLEPVVLRESHRQGDGNFLASLNSIRLGGTDGLGWVNTHARRSRTGDTIVLSTTNKGATAINLSRLASLEGESYRFDADVQGQVENLPADMELTLKVGARVMALVNDTVCDTYRNGSMGTVVDVSQDASGEPVVSVRFDDASIGTVAIGRHLWKVEEPSVVMDAEGRRRIATREVGSFTQLPLRLAYAVTVHKAQGQTYDGLVLSGRMFASGHLYVALSRLTSVNGLHLSMPIGPRDVILADSVRRFYDDPTHPCSFLGKAA